MPEGLFKKDLFQFRRIVRILTYSEAPKSGHLKSRKHQNPDASLDLYLSKGNFHT